MAEWRVYSEDELEKARKKARVRELKEKAKQKVEDGLIWVNNNKEALAVATPIIMVAGKLLGKSVKAANKKVDMKQQKDLKELYCYDRSLGHYWKLRRKLTNTEWVEIERRRKNGEKLADILSDMRVLD